MTFQICKEADGFRVLTINLDDQVKQLSAARKRKFKDGNLCASVKHWWGGKKSND